MSARTDLINGVRAWLQLANSSLTDQQVIRQDADGPRPPLPYLTVALTSEVPVGEVEELRSLDGSDDPIIHFRQSYRVTCTIIGYGDGADEWLRVAVLKLWSPAILAINETAGISLSKLGGLTYAPSVVDTRTEPRWIQEVLGDYKLSTEDDPESLIELAEIVVDAEYPDLPLDESDPDKLTDTITLPVSQ